MSHCLRVYTYRYNNYHYLFDTLCYEVWTNAPHRIRVKVRIVHAWQTLDYGLARQPRQMNTELPRKPTLKSPRCEPYLVGI